LNGLLWVFFFIKKAIAFCTILLHPITPNSSGKDENTLKINGVHIGLPFLEYVSRYIFHNEFFVLWIFLSWMTFDFLFQIFISGTQKAISDLLFQNVLFSILDFFIQNGILVFVFRFLFSKHNNFFRIYFSRMYYFQFQIFIFRINGIFIIL